MNILCYFFKLDYIWKHRLYTEYAIDQQFTCSEIQQLRSLKKMLLWVLIETGHRI